MINIDKKDLYSISFFFGLTKFLSILTLITLIFGKITTEMNLNVDVDIYEYTLYSFAYASLISFFIAIYRVLKIIVDAFNSLK